MPDASTTIVIAYDGSDESRNATATAVRLFSGRATVVHVWSPAAAVPTVGAPVAPGAVALDAEGRRALERHAGDVLDEGVELCRSGGLRVGGLLVEGEGVGDIAHAILAAGDEHDADVIVVGHRDRSSLASALLGSVSRDVVANAVRPVLVVPAPG